MSEQQDTIYALSTPPGKSAIAVIRISGERSLEIIRSMSTSMPTRPNYSSFNTVKTKGGEVIDQTITTFFKAPKSYTGENMVEVALHGGSAVIKKFIDNLQNFKKLRPAEPGEFTKRSFINNKLDLTQVEAIADLVNSETEIQRRTAYSHLRGRFSVESKKIFDNLKKTLADVDAIIDFSDEDLPKNLTKKIKEQIENICSNIKYYIQNSERGKKIRNGFIVAIIGKTNTGKSSFINNISNQEIAIVSREHGTTRDAIESFIDINGLPVRFFDTAGLRKSKNKVEKIGINRTRQISKDADLNLVFVNKVADIVNYRDYLNPIFVRSKCDILKKIKNPQIINISSKTSLGIDKLLNLIYKNLTQSNFLENIHVSRERQRICFKNSLIYLEKSKKFQNYDTLAEDLRQALKELSKIYGNVDIEEILDIIFADFCIGK